MKNLGMLIALGLLTVGLFAHERIEGLASGLLPPQHIAPTPSVPSDVPDLLPMFRKNSNKPEAREHALIASRLCNSISQAIRQDQALDKPLFQSTGQFDDLRIASIEYMLQGWKFSDHYDQFPETVGSFLIARTNETSGPIDQVVRDKWATAFQDLSKGFYKAYLVLFNES